MEHLSTLILLTLVLTTPFAVIESKDCKNKAPSRVELEEMFGKSVSCNDHRYDSCFDKSGKRIECPEPEGFVCYQNDRRIKIAVKFNSSDYAKRISISDGMKFWETVSAANQIIMLKGRGKSLDKVEKSQPMACESNFIEKYEYLTMEYWSKNCQGSMPGGVTITWKD